MHVSSAVKPRRHHNQQQTNNLLTSKTKTNLTKHTSRSSTLDCPLFPASPSAHTFPPLLPPSPSPPCPSPLQHGKDAGFLMNPGDGAVPCIQFFCPPSGTGGPSHMLSGSADGSIAVWQAGGRWEHLKLMKVRGGGEKGGEEGGGREAGGEGGQVEGHGSWERILRTNTWAVTHGYQGRWVCRAGVESM